MSNVFEKDKIARRQLDENELRTILLHERTHIRQAHLWYFPPWDILCALLWVNPLLYLSTPKLREDLEWICGVVTIRRSGRNSVFYGRVILKSMALLREASPSLSAAFAGETDFADAKARMSQVRDYRPYSRGRAAAFLVYADQVRLLLFHHAYGIGGKIETPLIGPESPRDRLEADQVLLVVLNATFYNI